MLIALNVSLYLAVGAINGIRQTSSLFPDMNICTKHNVTCIIVGLLDTRCMEVSTETISVKSSEELQNSVTVFNVSLFYTPWEEVRKYSLGRTPPPPPTHHYTHKNNVPVTVISHCHRWRVSSITLLVSDQ